MRAQFPDDVNFDIQPWPWGEREQTRADRLIDDARKRREQFHAGRALATRVVNLPQSMWRPACW